jgi:hypothetical protein
VGDRAGVIPLDADAILVVTRIAYYHARRFPPAQAHGGAEGHRPRSRVGAIAQRLGRLGRTHAEHSCESIIAPAVSVECNSVRKPFRRYATSRTRPATIFATQLTETRRHRLTWQRGGEAVLSPEMLTQRYVTEQAGMAEIEFGDRHQPASAALEAAWRPFG